MSQSVSSAKNMKKARSRWIDRNALVPRVKQIVPSTVQTEQNVLVEGTAVPNAQSGGFEALLIQERARQEEKKKRRRRKNRDKELKKQQIQQAVLKKKMLHRHWIRLEEAITKPPPPPAKEHKDAVPEPGDFEVDQEIIHPATISYHEMKHLHRDASIISPVFFGFPIDLEPARTPLVPDWKRALERKLPLPLHPSLRHPGMVGYNMHALYGWDQGIFNPIFYTYRTATGDHLKEEDIQELVNEKSNLYPHRPRFMWQLRDKFVPCFMCGEKEGEVKSCARCGHRKIGPADTHEVFNFVQAREMAAASPVADARGKKKEEIQLAKIMARSKYIDIMIKPMPMGGVVNLKMDNKCTIQYLYFLFRTNAGGAAAVHPRVNLFLPTYRGIFFLDCELIPETPTSLGSNAGYMTLANFNIVKAGDTVCLIESPTYRKHQSTKLINIYLTRNLVHDVGRKYIKEVQFHHDLLPSLIPHPNDFIQEAMRSGLKSMEEHWHENEKKLVKLKEQEKREMNEEEHRRRLTNSKRFIDKVKRQTMGKANVALVKARMKARKRQERDRRGAEMDKNVKSDTSECSSPVV